MQHGHIYPPAQAAAALEGFFRPSNLAALREMALRRTAEEVDEQLEEFMRESGRDEASLEEHVLVYVDASPFARTLVRRGWRLGQALHGDLIVAYMRRALGERDQQELARTVELAEDLNARVMPLEGPDEAAALGSLIAAEQVQHVVLAHERRSGLSALRPSLADKLGFEHLRVDVHLISGG
jgi:two-component system sensor histidine kinase KdpD